MRSLLLIIIITILSINFSSEINASASSEDKESIIVEVEGDPERHKNYLEVYHPFIEIVAIYEELFNGIALKAAPEKLQKVSTLEFVQAIHPVQDYHTNLDSFQELFDLENGKANRVLPADLNTTTFTGKGVKVGVIDTGINDEHPDLINNYQGGYDLVDLDDDPLETDISQGEPTIHGTHVAGIIGANGNLEGVAKDVDLHAYRALGPGGSGTSIQIIAAMEKAIQDGVDIINLSLGNEVNGPDFPTSIAVNRAVELGVSVVIANGNTGPENWTVGSPATATKALSVGAASLPEKIPYLHDQRSDKTIPLTVMTGSVPWQFEQDLKVVSFEEGQKQNNIRGKIALMKRGDTPFEDMAKKAEDNGAKALIIYNDEDNLFQGALEYHKPSIDIPVASISKQDGEWMLKQSGKESIYVQTSYKETALDIAPFSSRGPVTSNWDIKPDLLAPGTNVLSTVPNGYQELQGTSMAAPHVSGAIALVKEARPNWTTEQISGALKTTAQRIVSKEGQPIDPIIQGMGQIKPKQAIETETIIEHPLLAFGKVDRYLDRKKIEIVIENTTNQPQSYSFTVPKKRKGLHWKLPQSFTIEKNERKTIPIELSVTSPQLSDDIHQGWLSLHQADQTYYLPYLFMNQAAEYPKAMGFSLSPNSFEEDLFDYQFYLTEAAKSVEVHLYNPDTLVYERSLLQRTELKDGVNEGQLKRSEVGKRGYYKALITIQLENGKFESHEADVMIE